jgi:tetratricopeptide (TPR) repeat protein
MSMKKQIKIFAAFDQDVEEDIVRFGDFLCGLNAQCTGIEFSVFKSEKELCESLEQPKEQIDAELETCEYFLLILGGKNDEFALDKLNRAIERYAKTHGNPDVHIFVNTANKDAEKVINFFASEQYEHYVEQFKHHDTLKAKFLIWLSAKQKDFTYEVDKDIHGTPVIKVSGVPVSGLLDFDALLNNEDYKDTKKKLNRKRAERENLRKELHEAKGEERNDLWDDISALAKEINELQDKIASMEKDTLALYQNYAKITLASGYSARLKRALECIERGELDRARKVLDPDGSVSNLRALVNENEILAARIETNKKIAEQEINILFAEIDRLKMDTGNKNRFEEIEKCYANIEYFQEKLGLEMTVLFYYAFFLNKQNKYNAAIAKYEQLLVISRKRVETNPGAYLPFLAKVLNNLAGLQYDINRYTKVENAYAEALVIWRKLAETNPKAYVPDLAQALNNLALLKKVTNRYKESENAYSEALEIYRKLEKTNLEAYLPRLADTLNNYGVLQKDTNRYKEAESSFTEALEIRRKLAEVNPDAYLPRLADTLNNLGNLQKDTNRYKEAESSFTEALEIRRKLAEANPDAYLPHLADTLNNLAILQRKTRRYTEAESSLTEALEIRRKLAEANPDAHLSQLALFLNNVATLQYDTGRYQEAESSLTEALEIRRKLAEANPDVYLKELTETLENLIEVKEKLSKNEETDELKKKLAEIKKGTKK